MASKCLDELLADIKAAMKAGEKEKVTTLRMLHAQIKDAGTNAGKEETDELVITVVGKAIKQRNDSVEQYRDGGRDDLADKEAAEIEWLKKYQPEQMSEDEITERVKKAIEESGASGKQEIGKVMKVLMPQVKGKADGKRVNQIVQRELD